MDEALHILIGVATTRGDRCWNEVTRRRNLDVALVTWMVSAILVALVYSAIGPNPGDIQKSVFVVGVASVFVVFLSVASFLFNDPRRIIETWSAVRFDQLRILAATTDITLDEFQRLMVRIGHDRSVWLRKKDVEQYRGIISRARREGKYGQTEYPIGDTAQRRKFIEGEDGGPWEFAGR